MSKSLSPVRCLEIASAISVALDNLFWGRMFVCDLANLPFDEASSILNASSSLLDDNSLKEVYLSSSLKR